MDISSKNERDVAERHRKEYLKQYRIQNKERISVKSLP